MKPNKTTKKGEFNMMSALFLAVIVLAFYFIVFNSNIFAQISNSIAHLARPPSSDPTIWQQDFYSQRQTALGIYANISEAFNKTAGASQDTCFGFFQVPDNGFFSKGYNIQLLENEKKDGSYLRMLQWRADRTNTADTKSIADWEPLQLRFDIKGYLPCAVYGSPAENFYKDILENRIIKPPLKRLDFLDQFYNGKQKVINGKNNLLDKSDPSNPTTEGKQENYGIYGYYIDKFGLFPFQTLSLWGIDGKQIVINGKNNFLYFQGENVNYYILFKYNKMLCVLPDQKDWPGGCNPPSNGILDSDCLDSKSGTDRLPNLLKGPLNKYVCDGFQNELSHLTTN